MKALILLSLTTGYLLVGAQSAERHLGSDSLPSQESVITNLVLLIKGEARTRNQHLAKEDAIRQAAALKNRDSRVIDALLDNIWFTPYRVPINPMQSPTFARYPARDALVAIGEPVLPVLLSRLKLVEGAHDRKHYSMLLKIIAGDKAAALLREAIAESSNEAHRDRLQKCLDLLTAP